MCGRCGQVWHVVMAKMGDRIAKVVCKRCGGHHRYRDENANANADSSESPARPRRPTFGSGRRSRPARAEAATPPPFDPAKPPRTYAARDSYVAGERVSHPTFGVGVVSGSPGAGKVDVVFSSGARVLACAKETSTLARPVAMQGLPIPDRPPK
jgi:predicted  nucleic acid-binding Zn-ribbon protein